MRNLRNPLLRVGTCAIRMDWIPSLGDQAKWSQKGENIPDFSANPTPTENEDVREMRGLIMPYIWYNDGSCYC